MSGGSATMDGVSKNSQTMSPRRNNRGGGLGLERECHAHRIADRGDLGLDDRRLARHRLHLLDDGRVNDIGRRGLGRLAFRQKRQDIDGLGADRSASRYPIRTGFGRFRRSAARLLGQKVSWILVPSGVTSFDTVRISDGMSALRS